MAPRPAPRVLGAVAATSNPLVRAPQQPRATVIPTDPVRVARLRGHPVHSNRALPTWPAGSNPELARLLIGMTPDPRYKR